MILLSLVLSYVMPSAFHCHCMGHFISPAEVCSNLGLIATHIDTQSVQFRGGVLSCGLHAASGRIKSNPRSVTSELELAAERFALSCSSDKNQTKTDIHHLELA